MRVLVAGNVNVDLLLGPLSPWPQPGSEVVVDHLQLRVGGALGNTALAFHALGVPADYAANIGNDMFGRWLHEELAAHGCALSVTPGPTAVTVGLSHPDAQRTFITHEGHFGTFDIEPLRRQVEVIGPDDIFIICGYFLIPSLRAYATELCRTVRARGGAVLLDTGWPPEGWTDAVRREVHELLGTCNYFLPNREELTGLTEEPEVRVGLSQLPSPVKTIVKLGAAGAGYLDVGVMVGVRAPTVEVVDTVGAGDAFNAAFVYGLSEGRSWQQATELAVQAASQAVSSYPRRYALPSDLTISR